MADYDVEGPRAHPFLSEPLLHIMNLPPFVTNEDLARTFTLCAPMRPNVEPDDGSNKPRFGTIEFRYLESAEKALATLQGRPIAGVMPPVPVALSPYPPTTPPTQLPAPAAVARLVKQLPPNYSDDQLYNLFRPFGAIASVRTHAGFGPDTGVVEFWNEDDARAAEDAMHCADVEGMTISVQMYQAKRAAQKEFNTHAPAFVPTGSVLPYPQQPSPPRSFGYSPKRSPVQTTFQQFHGPGQQVQLAPLSGPGSNSHSGLIDPCNLFIKNLDPNIDSNVLFSHFRNYGRIVSARVMRNDAGESRGFGFVSFETPDQANAAMHGMNGQTLNKKQIMVRLHEPRQLRQEKLAHRFGTNTHPKPGSGATSPTPSEFGEYGAFSSPETVLVGTPEIQQRQRRGSGSYYQAALAGTLDIPMRYDDLASLSAVMRKEVLSGEFNRRIHALGTVYDPDVETIVEQIIGLSLSDVVAALNDPGKFVDLVESGRRKAGLATKEPSPKPDNLTAANASPSPVPSYDSRLLDSTTLNATASAPEHPSTPVSLQASLSTPPRTSSPSPSTAPPLTDRDKMAAAIVRLEGPGADAARVEQLLSLMMGLPKKDRAMALFNPEHLRIKLAEAKVILDDDDEDDTAPAMAVPTTPRKTSASTALQDSPHTPDLSSRVSSTVASPMPATPSSTVTASAVGGAHTVGSVAKLPASEIVRLLSNGSLAYLKLPKADPLVVEGTDTFVDDIMTTPMSRQRQVVGDKLHKALKSYGLKKAAKLTIQLVDKEDLRALAHLMNEYPDIMKEKAIYYESQLPK